MEVYVIPVRGKDYDRGFRVLEGIGPSEFLSEFKNADYVCTDSFHGTVFSIIYHKPFIVFKRFSDNDPKSQNSRVLNLLNSLNLEKHLWNGIPRFAVTNWELVDEILGELRKKSLEYLKNALTRATQSKNEKNKHKVITNTCCGCGVCAKNCPKRAIKMKMVNGFYQAVVNDVLCINCGLCNHICAFNGEVGIQLNDASLFEAKSKDKKILQASTSGGIAQEIILKLLKKNYPVWGCVFDTEDGRVKHTLLSHFDETAAARFQGSKYLQSCFFEDDVSILDKSQGVIIGTPCQIAATDNYLRNKKKRNQFILVDLICHGVPTKNLWKVYLKDEGMKEEDVTEVHFRDSNMGWREIYIYIKSTQKEIHRKETKDLFYKFFDLQACYMPSCYECNYRTTSKADIRLGDYWGKKYTPDDLRYGVSMVVAFSEHGRAILRELKSDGRIELAERPIQDYFSGQGPVNPIVPLYYSKLMADLENNKESLRSLLYKHCYIKYLNKRIQLRVAKIRKIILKR